MILFTSNLFVVHEIQGYSSNQLGILSYVTIIHQPVTVGSSMHMQPSTCTCTNEAFSNTSIKFIPTLAGVVAYMFYTSQSRD